jgi:hypothetical protein
MASGGCRRSARRGPSRLAPPGCVVSLRVQFATRAHRAGAGVRTAGTEEHLSQATESPPRLLTRRVRLLFLFALSPLMLAALPIVFGAIAIYIIFAVPVLLPVQSAQRRRKARELRRAMEAAGRVTTWDDIEGRLASAPGTLVEAAGEAGWSLWFAPESVSQLDHPPLPDLAEYEPDERFWVWCTGRYTDPATGCALLLEQPARRRDLLAMDARIVALQQRHPALEYISLESYGPDLYRQNCCRRCGYSRTGLDPGACPECGHPCPVSRV